MNAIYFLSVLLNAMAGIYLVSEFLSSRVPALTKVGSAFDEKKVFGYIFAGLLIAVAILKLFVIVPSLGKVEIGAEESLVAAKKLLIIGDLLPFLAGVIAGITIIFEMIASRNSAKAVLSGEDESEDVDAEVSGDELESGSKFGNALLKWKAVIGFVVIVIAFMHFVAPGVAVL
jgi:hypothetical protein